MNIADPTDESILRHITFRPGRLDPDDALVGYQAVPIWVVIDYALSVDLDIAEVSWMYDLTADEVRAALAYYERYRQLIDARILIMTWRWRNSE